MSQSARILVADDDESYLENVARMLRFVGYHCDCAPNGEAACQRLTADSYDLLVADIEMPGNEHLELVEWSAGHDAAMSVLLVTGHPTVPTAMQAFKLPVAAYLEKPLAPPYFLAQVGRAIERTRLRRVVEAHRQRMDAWKNDLAQIEKLLQGTLGEDVRQPQQAYVSMALSNLITALTELKDFTEALVQRQQDEPDRHLLEWPQPLLLIDAVRETVAVLEKTKGAFKSKELGDLRKKLELLLQIKE
jgi:DNA-binding NtrC family response regulator